NTYISLDYVKQEAYIYKKHDHQILKHSLPIEKEEPLRKELEHFCECIREDKTPLISGKEAQEALKVALAITQQIWDNRKNISSS
ncbi:MAG: gfo/Idh/MocA family oxidoreductase, partial [Candidatus Omnitrophica bacterium]|nr:gfo/Idh/MocA family oxidoreductase [Candidatus Omnitrophota bacterium]